MKSAKKTSPRKIFAEVFCFLLGLGFLVCAILSFIVTWKETGPASKACQSVTGALIVSSAIMFIAYSLVLRRNN